jgi:hypothetical protein
MAKAIDWNEVGAEAAIAAIVIALAQSLNGTRSVVIQVDNRTASTMKLISSHHVHGGFGEPPDDIPPHTASLFSSQNIGGSVGTGTEGSCSYLADGVQFDVFWDNPFFGSNNASQQYSGAEEARFQMSPAFAGVGNTGAHSRYQIFDRPLADFRSPLYRGNPSLIQGRFNADLGHGNYELIVPLQSGGIAAYFRLNNEPGRPWQASAVFGQSVGPVEAVSMIQSHFGDPGNLEVVARVRDTLQFFFRDSGPQFIWNGPFPIRPDQRLINDADGNPVLIQSRNGHTGNFELITPLAHGGLAHYFRDNDAADFPWHGPTIILAPDRHFEAVTMIESSIGGSNLEVVAQSGQQFFFFFRTNPEDNFQWHGPFPLVLGGQDFVGGGGNLALIQSRFGSNGINFELVGIVASLFGGQGPMFHAFRNNDVPDMPWTVTGKFGEGITEEALTMIQTDIGTPGNLEVIARLTNGGLAFTFRDSGPEFKWNGPFIM